MRLITAPYREQIERWPTTGRHILAQFDAETVVVYQAYRPAIGCFAAEFGYFGGEFSFTRMSWIKPNFLWMMFRNGWGTKQDQEVTLAVWLRRSGFDAILKDAVHSSFVPEVYGSEAAWKQVVSASSVRLQWDPDHDPTGGKVERRAIQLGLRDDFLAKYAREWVVHVEDVSSFVEQQRPFSKPSGYDRLLLPREIVYPIEDADVAGRLELTARC